MGRPRSYDRVHVLEQAEQCFRATGYAGTSLDDLCTATGLGRGSMYAGFGDKHTLFMDALDSYCSRTAARVRSYLEGPDEGAVDRIRHFIRSAPRFVLNDRESDGCMAGRFALELGAEDAQARERITGVFDDLQRAIANCIEAAKRHGDVRSDADGSAIAWLIVTLSRGLDVMVRGGVDERQLKVAAEQMLDLIPLA